MAGISLNINGIDKVFNDLNKLSDKVKIDIAREMASSALNIQTNAKKNAPINFGTLRNSIHFTEELGDNKLLYTIGSNLSYAPYIEFGTGGKVNTQGYDDFANKFKGKTGGAFKDLLLALIEWVKKKGIVGTYSIKTQRRTGGKSIQKKQNEAAAYAIAISILKKGIRPQAYLLPAYEQEIPKLIQRIKNTINA